MKSQKFVKLTRNKPLEDHRYTKVTERRRMCQVLISRRSSINRKILTKKTMKKSTITRKNSNMRKISKQAEKKSKIWSKYKNTRKISKRTKKKSNYSKKSPLTRKRRLKRRTKKIRRKRKLTRSRRAINLIKRCWRKSKNFLLIV